MAHWIWPDGRGTYQPRIESTWGSDWKQIFFIPTDVGAPQGNTNDINYITMRSFVATVNVQLLAHISTREITPMFVLQP